MARPVTPAALRLKRATKLAVQAAGGLEECACATGLSTSQISRCCQADAPDSLTIRDAEVIDSLSQTHFPYILNEWARLAGHVLVRLPQGPAEYQALVHGIVQLSTELGDVARSVSDALSDGACTPREAQRALDELTELETASARLRGHLMAIAYPGVSA
jgi:hypothetical protein